MALTKKQENQLNGKIKKTLEEVRFQGLKAGAARYSWSSFRNVQQR